MLAGYRFGRSRSLVASFALDASQHRAPTQSAASVGPCGFSIALCRNTFDRLGADRRRAFWSGVPVFATRRCIGRVARPAGHASATFCAGVPLPAGRFTWPGRAPFGVEAFSGFRPVIAADTRSAKTSRV